MRPFHSPGGRHGCNKERWQGPWGSECLTRSGLVESHQARDATNHADGGRNVGSRRSSLSLSCSPDHIVNAPVKVCAYCCSGPGSFRMHQTWVFFSTSMQAYPRRDVTGNGPQELIKHRVGEGARPPAHEGLGIRRVRGVCPLCLPPHSRQMKGWVSGGQGCHGLTRGKWNGSVTPTSENGLPH